MEWSKKVACIVEAAFDSILDKMSYPLEESVHAPKPNPDVKHTVVAPSSSSSSSSLPVSHPPPPSPPPPPPPPSSPSPPSSSSSSFSPPSPHHSPTPFPSLNSNHFSQTLITDSQPSIPPSNMSPLADVDDAEGFMAAARSLKIDPAKYMDPHTAETVGEDEPVTAENGDANGIEILDNVVLPDAVEVDQTAFSGPGVTEANDWGASNVSNAEPTPSVSLAADAGVLDASIQDEQNREHLSTFKTWGVPEVRHKAASRVRRVVLKTLPSNWCAPTKVLSLIHGGQVESIRTTPTGVAHVLFCDADACQAFHDKYPNGIDLDKDRKVTVFVEMGKEVDVVSSYLSFLLSVGATRVVRAVGVDMGISMARLVELSSVSERKVEKIIDILAPGDARTVVFRFTNIDDAVTFRSMIVRDEQWEHCNVQYAADPCEVATGFHAD